MSHGHLYHSTSGIITGVVFLNEVIDSIVIVGTGLIFLGITFTKPKVFEHIRVPISIKKGRV